MVSTLAYTKLVRMAGSVEAGVVMTVGALVVPMVGRTLDVDRKFLRLALRCPFAVARDFGRNFRTAPADSPGHLVKKLFFDGLDPSGNGGTETGLVEQIDEGSLGFLFVGAVGTMLVVGVLGGWCHSGTSRLQVDEPHLIAGITLADDVGDAFFYYTGMMLVQ
jgi:hypothetical protein